MDELTVSDVPNSGEVCKYLAYFVDSDAEESDVGLAFFRMFPLGVCTRWFSPPSLWVSLRRGQLQSAECALPLDALLHLLRDVEAWNRSIPKLFSKEASNARSFALSLNNEISPSNLTRVITSHHILQAVLLDRLLYSSSFTPSPPYQERYFQTFVELRSNKALEYFRRLAVEWPETVHAFIENWRSQKSVAEFDDDQSNTVSKAEFGAVGRSLFCAMKKNMVSGATHTARSNFLAASLGLFAIINVSKWIRSKVPRLDCFPQVSRSRSPS